MHPQLLIKKVLNLINIGLFYTILFHSDLNANKTDNEFLFNLESLSGKTNNFYEDYRKIGLYEFIYSNGYSFFLNSNGFIVGDKKTGISTGIGFRRVYEQGVFGLNFYHDFQCSPTILHQIGIGFDYFSKSFFLNGNIYLPLGKKSFNEKECVFNDYQGDYVVKCKNSVKLASGFEINISTLLHKIEIFSSYLKIGLYGISYAKHEKALGILAGLQFNISEQVNFTPQFNYDRLYGTNLGMKLTIAIPLTNFFDSKHRLVSRKMGVAQKNITTYKKNY